MGTGAKRPHGLLASHDPGRLPAADLRQPGLSLLVVVEPRRDLVPGVYQSAAHLVRAEALGLGPDPRRAGADRRRCGRRRRTGHGLRHCRSRRPPHGGCRSPGKRAHTRGRTWRAFACTGPDAPGDAVDDSVTLADITAYPAGIATDGFGLGGFGSGGFGQSAGNYAWTSCPLAAGTWTFAVVPVRCRGEPGGRRRRP